MFSDVYCPNKIINVNAFGLCHDASPCAQVANGVRCCSGLGFLLFEGVMEALQGVVEDQRSYHTGQRES